MEIDLPVEDRQGYWDRSILFQNRGQGTKKAQEIEQKSEHPFCLLNLNEILTTDEAM